MPHLLRSVAFAAIVAMAIIDLAHGQDRPYQNIRGQISAVEGSSITVTTKSGETLRLALASDVFVTRVTKGRFLDVELGTYVVSAAVGPGADGWTYNGLELRIYAEELRGVDLGHAKWDLTPESTITGGWVDDLEERVLSIKYDEGEFDEKDVEIPRDVPIVRIEPGDQRLLVPGAAVFAVAEQGADGKLTALSITVGKDGVSPPM